jgi:hypothetical protein
LGLWSRIPSDWRSIGLTGRSIGSFGSTQIRWWIVQIHQTEDLDGYLSIGRSIRGSTSQST